MKINKLMSKAIVIAKSIEPLAIKNEIKNEKRMK